VIDRECITGLLKFGAYIPTYLPYLPSVSFSHFLVSGSADRAMFNKPLPQYRSLPGGG
jgi:hypothetical protein